jgi:hypothetical protein
MWLTEIAARRREVASRIEVVAKHSDLDIPDELVPKVVMNGFMDDKIWEGFRSGDRRNTQFTANGGSISSSTYSSL